MAIYHKIITNGKTLYRQYYKTTNVYDDEMITEEELIERLFDQMVGSTIEIDYEEIEKSIDTIPSSHHRAMIKNYISYLEAVAETLR